MVLHNCADINVTLTCRAPKFASSSARIMPIIQWAQHRSILLCSATKLSNFSSYKIHNTNNNGRQKVSHSFNKCIFAPLSGRHPIAFLYRPLAFNNNDVSSMSYLEWIFSSMQSRTLERVALLWSRCCLWVERNRSNLPWKKGLSRAHFSLVCVCVQTEMPTTGDIHWTRPAKPPASTCIESCTAIPGDERQNGTPSQRFHTIHDDRNERSRRHESKIVETQSESFGAQSFEEYTNNHDKHDS